MVSKERLFFFGMLLLILAALVRIVSTYQILSQTWDEPGHIAAGMEWLESRRYTFEHQHPPLARVFDAIGLYLDGKRLSGIELMYEEGNDLLYRNGEYDRNLTLARLGVLPFFILACLVIWSWAKQSFGLSAGLLSVFFLSMLPPVLAHAGIAATDMAAAATLVCAFYMLFLWLQQPNLRRSILLGISVAACILSKFSNIPFLLLGGLSILKLKSIANGESKTEAPPAKLSRVPLTLIACFVCLIAIWAGYLFSVGRWNGLVVPAPELFSGIGEVIEHNREGHLTYLLGQTYTQGRFIYFPIAIALKTPIAFLLLSLAGSVMLTRKALANPKQALLMATPIAGLCVLAVGIISNLNLGIRHILAMYLLLSVAAGAMTAMLWNSVIHRVFGRALVIFIVLSMVISSFGAHPDYLAYYNLLGGKHPEEIVLDTSDWGQDARRLGILLKRRGIDRLSVCYYGSADLEKLGILNGVKLEPYKKTTGWVAASLLCNKMGTWEPPYDQFAWLDHYQPVEMAGKSIRLYYIPERSQ